MSARGVFSMMASGACLLCDGAGAMVFFAGQVGLGEARLGDGIVRMPAAAYGRLCRPYSGGVHPCAG